MTFIGIGLLHIMVAMRLIAWVKGRHMQIVSLALRSLHSVLDQVEFGRQQQVILDQKNRGHYECLAETQRTKVSATETVAISY